MNIVVIGDYESLQYQDLLQIVRIAFPDDKVLDLSIHKTGDYKSREKARQNVIKGAFMFVYDQKWEESTEIRQDITYAQKAGLDGYLYAAGQFRAYTSVYRKS
jgi:hypothetical protein